MFMVSVCGHAPPFGAQPHTSMWLCPTIISDPTDFQYHYSGFEMDMRVVHRNTKAHGVLSKVKQNYILYVDELFPTFLESRGIMACQLG